VVLDPPLPEIAFVGRSNVGKSSLLNALIGHRVARISATPGKTRALNVFEAQLRRGEKGEERGTAANALSPLPSPVSLYLLDLPGYGFARVSKAQRTTFLKLLGETLHRPHLRGVIWLLDLRHAPSDGDRAMQDQLAQAGTAVLATATKSDKLSAARRQTQALALRTALGMDDEAFLVTSARTGAGIADLREALVGRLTPADR